MMSKYRCDVFLLLTAVSGLLSVSVVGTTTTYVCSGDDVQVLQNIKFNSCSSVITLSRNGDRNIEIAMWSYHNNCSQNATISPKYKDRVFFDQGTITIHKFHHFDQAKYVAITKTDQLLPVVYEVEIRVVEAPKKVCEPVIERGESVLVASLKAEDCGFPVANLYWEDHKGVVISNESILRLSQGHESASYFACIRGPAVKCAKYPTRQDYCFEYTIKESEKSPTTTQEGCNNNMAALIAVSIFLALVFIWAIAVSVLYIRKRRERNTNDSNQRDLLLPLHPQGKQHSKLLRLWNKHFESLRWEDITQFLNDDQKLGLQAYINKLNPVGDNKQHVLEIQRKESDPLLDTQHHPNSSSEHDMNNSGIENQPDIDPAAIKELRELRDSAMCKICLGKQMRVCFMPCKHMATCEECSTPLDTCPICRATIEEKMNIRFE